LDPSLYGLDPAALEFFQQQTGITNEDDLKHHILAVQAKAFAVAPYPCIYSFGFTRLRISRHPKYQSVLQFGRDCTNPLFLDLGCCFGNDARKAVADGWPVTQMISTDLRQELWDLGHVLFRSTPTSFPSHFIAGDCLDPAFLSCESRPTSQSLPDLSSLATLNDLHGKLSAVHASSIFHLFSAEQQASLVRAVASLLSPVPGSIVFGAHVGLPKQGTVREEMLGMAVEMYCYDPESWNKLWEDAGPFKMETVLKEVIAPNGEIGWMMVWSATMSTKSTV
jgi:SAM-dependent methyltransferase